MDGLFYPILSVFWMFRLTCHHTSMMWRCWLWHGVACKTRHLLLKHFILRFGHDCRQGLHFMLDLSVGIAFKTTKKEETSVGYNVNCSKYGIFWIICLTWLVKALFDLMFPPFQEFPLSFGTFFQPALCARSVPDLAWWTLRTMSTLTNRLAVFYISFHSEFSASWIFRKPFFHLFPAKNVFFFFACCSVLLENR